MQKDELIAKAQKPAEDAMELHPFYQGKVEVSLKAPVRDVNDFAIWYTPGVAAPCLAIRDNKKRFTDIRTRVILWQLFLMAPVF